MPDIEKRQLGRTNLLVSTLGFGAMDIGGMPVADEISDAEAAKVLNAVLDNGINFIDTAGCYGKSEARIGKALSHRRHEFVLATKCGCVPGLSMGSPHDNTAANIRAGVEHSLRTMRTDYLDIMQFHINLSRAEWEKDGALTELLKLKQEGKLRFIGISGVLPNLIEQVNSGLFDVFQIPYSALQREHEDIIEKASAAGGGIIIRGGVARGSPTNWNKYYYMLTSDEMSGRWNRAHLDELLGEMNRMEFMVRFVLSEQHLDTTIIGTKSLAHLQNNVAAAQKGPLPSDVIKEAKHRLDMAG